MLGGPLWANIRTATLDEALRNTKEHCLYVGGTAYNFLNVFKSAPSNARPDKSLSESGLHCMECSSEILTNASFAILSSRLVFWLWHVEGDGFHVSRNFIERTPFGSSSFSDSQLSELARLGADLWRDLQDHQVVSVNKGKTSFAFRPLACELLRNQIDAVLIKAADLPKSFEGHLRSFVRQTVVVDETDERREHAMEFFVREVSNVY